jgi:hypothetical protein
VATFVEVWPVELLAKARHLCPRNGVLRHRLAEIAPSLPLIKT